MASPILRGMAISSYQIRQAVQCVRDLKTAGRSRIAAFRLMRRLLPEAPVKHIFSEFYDNQAATRGIHLEKLQLFCPQSMLENYVIRHFETRTRAALRAATQPGGVFVDVGAHIGWHALEAAKQVGPQGHVYAIEPAQENLRFLRRNIALNGQEGHVTIHPVAAAAQRQKRAFHLASSCDNHSFYGHPVVPEKSVVDVQACPLDDLVEGKVSVLKIDVEGAELEVLSGMDRILSDSDHLTICVEWNPACMEQAGTEPDLLPRRLQELGFTNLQVLNDVTGTVLELDDCLPQVRRRQLPADWYTNIVATRVS